MFLVCIHRVMRLGRHRRCHAGCVQLSRAQLRAGESKLAGPAATAWRLLATKRCTACCWFELPAAMQRLSRSAAQAGHGGQACTKCCPARLHRKCFNCCSALRELQAVGHRASALRKLQAVGHRAVI